MLSAVLVSNDPVLVSYVENLLFEAGLTPVVLDVHMSVLEGSLGVLPRRVMVDASVRPKAVSVLKEAGLSAWINADDTSV
jgi:hypothetical protein